MAGAAQAPMVIPRGTERVEAGVPVAPVLAAVTFQWRTMPPFKLPTGFLFSLRVWVVMAVLGAMVAVAGLVLVRGVAVGMADQAGKFMFGIMET